MLQFKKTAQAQPPAITLADIAEIIDPDPTVAGRLGPIILAPAPGPGRQTRLSLDAIRSRLRARGVNMLTTEFSGSSMVIVSSAEGNATAGSPFGRGSGDVPIWKTKRATRLVVQAIQQYLGRVSPQLSQVDVSLNLTNLQTQQLLLGAATGYDVRGGMEPWIGPQFFELWFFDRGKKLFKVQVACQITQKPHVFAVKHTVERGHLIRKADLVWRQADDASDGFTRLEDVLGKEATRTIRSNEVISKATVRAVPLVRRNDIVTVSAGTSAITVQREMKALSAGSMGETVKLVSLDSKQTMFGKVTGVHQAQAAGTPGGIVPASNSQVIFRDAIGPATRTLRRTPAPRVLGPSGRPLGFDNTRR